MKTVSYGDKCLDVRKALDEYEDFVQDDIDEKPSVQYNNGHARSISCSTNEGTSKLQN